MTAPTPFEALRLALAAALALGLTGALVVCSGLPYASETSEHAMVRLSWRAVGERVEQCRKPTPEEIAALPVHMRRDEICEGRLAPFQLEVRIDGRPAFEGRVRPAGTRHDRPAYVFQEFPVAPGSHRLEVRFATELPEGSDRPPQPPATLDETLVLAPREIAVVTYDDATGRLARVERPRVGAP